MSTRQTLDTTGCRNMLFMLQPPLQGAPARDFARFAEDLESGIEAKSLSDSVSIPHSSRSGQNLTLQLLKEEVSRIISDNPVEWVRGCVGVQVGGDPVGFPCLPSPLCHDGCADFGPRFTTKP